METVITPLETQIFSNPNFETNEINSRELGGKKRRVTVLRKKFNNALKVQKITQKQLASTIGVFPTEVSAFIKGRYVSPNSTNKLVKALQEVLLRNPKVSKTNKVVKPIETGTNNYAHNNEAEAEKHFVRTAFVNRIGESGVLDGTFLGLPFSTCATEIEINQNHPNQFHYIGVECNKDTYKSMKKTIKENELNMTPIKGFMGDVIFNSKRNTFSHIFLDYCKTFTTHKREIEYTIENDLVKVGGYIGITVSKRDANSCKAIQQHYPKSLLDRLNLSDTEVNILTSLSSKNFKDNYQITDFIPYHDSSSMLMLIVKRLS